MNFLLRLVRCSVEDSRINFLELYPNINVMLLLSAMMPADVEETKTLCQPVHILSLWIRYQAVAQKSGKGGTELGNAL
ncbi:hypothetical protein GJAV_G00114590 [Gymnothorax javanicus]|nr:hypothetical protein GJAV_G00114590 [Gymnothorax javanicus]